MSPDSVGEALLIASPQMQDPVFAGTVVRVWHHDEDGALGGVINRPLDHSLDEVLVLDEDGPGLPDDDHTPVLWGGPVELGMGTVVTRGAVAEREGWPLASGVGVTRSLEALMRLLGDGEPVLLCLGYAGWGPGQLDREIEAGGWLWTDIDPTLLFEEPADVRYERALASLGLTRANVWMQPISE